MGVQLIVVAAWGSILLMGVTDPLGGINTLFPLFGIANQLLAAIALTVVTVVVIKRGLLKWAWIPGVPLVWDLIVTMTASYQKIFSGDPKIGYWTQHFQYVDAKDAGKTTSARPRTPTRSTRSSATRSSRAPCRSSSPCWSSSCSRPESSWRCRSIRGGGQPAVRGRAGAVAALRAVGHDPDRSREGGAEAMGRTTRRHRRQIGWYWGSLMGDNHYQRYVEHRGAHPSR